MHLPDSLFSGNDNESLRSFVQSLLDTVKEQSAVIEKQAQQIEDQKVRIDRLVEENEQLRTEIRHLKKHKGKPKIRPNVSDAEDRESEHPETNGTENGETKKAGKNDHDRPPKGKRPRPQKPGETAAPPVKVSRVEICTIPNPGQNWRFKGYADYHHTELELLFETTLYRRACYQTPEGFVTAPLPEHVNDRFGNNLKAHVLNFYHSCSTTQPLLLGWLHDHDCPISEGSLHRILTGRPRPLPSGERRTVGNRISLFQLSSGGWTPVPAIKGKTAIVCLLGTLCLPTFTAVTARVRINFPELSSRPAATLSSQRCRH